MKGLVVIPFIDCEQENRAALNDALQQLDCQVDVLLIDQGSTDPGTRQWAENLSSHNRVRVWRHHPPLPSLAATWNRALDYAWEARYADCMVWNNDVRVGSLMYACLRRVSIEHQLWFTTPVNCALGSPEAWTTMGRGHELDPMPDVTKGGPDFSCFLITPECHAKYRFDERFQPAYHEDGDFHRRMWLGGDGARIAGVTLPYLHYGSRTINRSPDALAAFQPQFAACRQRYVQKWGGEPHHERKITPDSEEDFVGVGTPGGYLDMPPPALSRNTFSGCSTEGVAVGAVSLQPTLAYPKNVVPMNEQGPLCGCGAQGFAWSWGTRAGGAVYNGCDFCTGVLNGETDCGPGHRLDADNRMELCVDGVPPPAPETGV